MERHERIRQAFTKSMRLIEIGASYNPIIPKRDGWKTTVVDHATRVVLLEKYRDVPAVKDDPAIIETVNVIWQSGTLAECFSEADQHTYDGLIASHVIEHLPDFVGFLRSVDVLLKPSGMLFLAVPDKRLCFDFFQPLTTTGDVLDGIGKSRHSQGTLYDHAAYYATRNGEGAWFSGLQGGDFALAHRFEQVRPSLNYTEADGYVDSHTWRFTPASFELLLLELNALGLINWKIVTIEPQAGVEFFVWLERGTVDAATIDQRRIELLQEMVMETREQVRQLQPAPVAASLLKPDPLTISAIVPLYNGAKFIAGSLDSILTQTLPPCEIIVVDDGSADDGAAIVQGIIDQQPSEGRPPITLLRKDNGGQSSARNFGVAHSTGKLIALLDQDDGWYPHHLEELIKPFSTGSVGKGGKELGWVYSDLDEYDSKDGMVHHCFLRTRGLGSQHPKTELFACLASDMFILPSASLISRKAFDAVGGFDVRLSGYEDDDLFLRLFRAGYANIFLEEALSKWRIYPDSSSYSYRMRRSRAVYMRKLLEEYPDDATRSRFLTRDLIIPRFYLQALAEYLKALKEDDAALIEETREELLYILDLMPGRRKRMMGQVINALRSPRVARLVYSARPYLRPITRRFV